VSERTILAATAVLFVSVLLFVSFTLSPVSRGVPLAVAVPTLVLALATLVLDLRSPAPPEKQAGSGEARLMLWMLLLPAMAWSFGMLVALPAYTMVYLRVRSRESWRGALLAAAGLWAVLYTAGTLLLRTRLLDGWFLG
jgi:hypothetical protein